MGVRRVMTGRFVGGASTTGPLYSELHVIRPHSFEVDASCPWLARGRFRSLRMKLDAGLAAGQSLVVTVRLNGADTALTGTLTSSVTEFTSSHTVAVADGDLVNFKLTPSTTNILSGRVLQYALEVESDVTGQSAYCFEATPNGSFTTRNPPFNAAGWNIIAGTTINNLVAANGSITKYQVIMSGPPGAGKSYEFSLWKNSVKQDGSGGAPDTRGVISGNVDTTVTVSTPVALVAGDHIYFECVPTGTPAANTTKVGVQFTATTDGESQYCGWSNDGTVNGATKYNLPPAIITDLWTTTEADAEHIIAADSVTLRGFRVALSGNFTGSFVTRRNRSTPSGTPTITLAAASSGVDATGSVVLTAADTFAIQYTQTAVGNRTLVWAWVMFSEAEQCLSGGHITVVADQTDGETFTGRTLNPRAWLTLGYDDADRSFAMDSYNHPATYYGGRKTGALVQVGSINRQLSDRFSNYKMADCLIDVDDSSRLLSTLEAATATQYWANREGRIYLASAETIAAAGVPHVLFRGIWREHRSTGFRRSIGFTDVLGSEFSDFNIEDTIPRRTITTADFPNAPEAAIGKVVPIAYGRITDEHIETVVAPGLPVDPTLPRPSGVIVNDLANGIGDMSGRRFVLVTNVTGLVESDVSNLAGTIESNRALRVRWYQIPSASSYRVYFFNGLDGSFDPHTGAHGDATFVRYVTHDNTTLDGTGGFDFELVINHDSDGTDAFGGVSISTDTGRGKIAPIYVGTRTLLDNQVWHEFVIAGHAITHIEGLYQDGKRLDATLTDILAPESAAWATATGSSVSYRDYHGHRYAVVFLRSGSVLGDSCAGGTTPLTVNICGVDDIGNGTGNTITIAPRAAYHLLEQWVLQDYQTGLWAAASTSDDNVPWLNSVSFQALESIEQQRVGEEGYQAAMYLDQPITVRELLGRILTSFDMRFGQNEHGQVVAKHLNSFADLSSAVTLTDVQDLVDDTEIDRRLNELENKVIYDWNYRPADQTFENADSSVEDAAAIAANRGETAVGDHRAMYYTMDATTANDVAFRALAVGKYPPRYVTLTCTLHHVRVKLGDIVLVNDVEGIGATGWVGRPLWVLGIETILGTLDSPPRVRLTCEDVKDVLATHIIPIPLPLGTISLTGYVVQSRSVVVALPRGTVTLTGYAPRQGIVLLPVGAITMTGLAPATTPMLPMPKGTVTFTGQAAAVRKDTPIAAGLGSIALSGQYVAVVFLAPGVGTVTLTGRVPTLVIA